MLWMCRRPRITLTGAEARYVHAFQTPPQRCMPGVSRIPTLPGVQRICRSVWDKDDWDLYQHKGPDRLTGTAGAPAGPAVLVKQYLL